MRRKICDACEMDLDIVYITREVEAFYDEGKYHIDGREYKKVRCGECGHEIELPKSSLDKAGGK